MLKLVEHRSASRNTVLGRETSEAQMRLWRVSANEEKKGGMRKRSKEPLACGCSWPTRAVAVVERWLRKQTGTTRDNAHEREGSQEEKRSGCVSNGAERVGVSENDVDDGRPLTNDFVSWR